MTPVVGDAISTSLVAHMFDIIPYAP